MSYVVRGLDPAPYRPLFGLTEQELADRGVVRMTVSSPTFPCRVSLTDRAIGETVLLVNHVSHDVGNPYRASHAIFVTEGVEQPAEYVDRVPPVFEKADSVAAWLRRRRDDGRRHPDSTGRSRRRHP